jgi:hypothetical protein
MHTYLQRNNSNSALSVHKKMRWLLKSQFDQLKPHYAAPCEFPENGSLRSMKIVNPMVLLRRRKLDCLEQEKFKE